MKRFSPKNIAWYVGDKFIVPTTLLLGVGAARAVDDKNILEAIVNTVKFPIDSLFTSAPFETIARTFLDLGDNVFENPYATVGCLAGGYVVGKAAKMYSEHRRLKKRYSTEPTPAARYGLHTRPVPAEPVST